MCVKVQAMQWGWWGDMGLSWFASVIVMHAVVYEICHKCCVLTRPCCISDLLDLKWPLWRLASVVNEAMQCTETCGSNGSHCVQFCDGLHAVPSWVCTRIQCWFTVNGLCFHFLHKVGGANIRTKAWYLLLAACVCVESKVFKPDKVVGLDAWGVDTRSRQRCGEDNSRPADICWNSVGASKRSYERKDEQVETWKSLQHCAMGNDFCVI